MYTHHSNISLVVAVSKNLAIGKNNAQEVFVVGGAQIYNVALPLAHKIYITKVDATFDDADTFSRLSI
ncbi:MAG: dihydrofolate reductase [Bacteroidetes bacterium]|nr:dihydrofolate reductase [Bacteroidota bacterium]